MLLCTEYFSGLTGENILERKEQLLNSWYKGATLVEAIDELVPPARNIESPLRFTISDVFKSNLHGSEVSIGGKVECGSVVVGEPVLLLPQNHTAIVKSISSMIGDSRKIALAGDNVELGLNRLGEFADVVSSGQILCEYSNPIPVTRRIAAKVLVLALEMPLIQGSELILHANSLDVPCHVSKLVQSLSKQDGSVLKSNPRCLGAHSSGVLELELSRPVCLEPFSARREFGRITLRREGRTVAAGVVLSVDKL